MAWGYMVGSGDNDNPWSGDHTTELRIGPKMMMKTILTVHAVYIGGLTRFKCTARSVRNGLRKKCLWLPVMNKKLLTAPL